MSCAPKNAGLDSKLPEEVVQGQYQLFVLMHLLQEAEATAMLIVEGTEQGVQPRFKCGIEMTDGERFSLYDEIAQHHLLTHPNDFINLQSAMFERGQMPIFYGMTNYEYVQGAHKSDIYALFDRDHLLMAKVEQFMHKYHPRDGQDRVIHPEEREGFWWILINGSLVDPAVLHSKCIECLDWISELDRVNSKLEQEMVEHFEEADAAKMPFCWTGLVHVEPIKKACLDNGMSVRTIIPTANSEMKMPKSPREIVETIKNIAHIHMYANQRSK